MKKIIVSVMGLLLILPAVGCAPGQLQANKNGYPDRGYDDRNSGRYYDQKEGYQKEVRETGAEDETIEFGDDDREYTTYNGEFDRRENPSPTGFYQKGMASWYGREFHGKVTASGERFNMYDYTAAHKTLPFGTILEVKNIDNGKSVRVTVNDRGPYRGNRILDLSYNAGKKIGILRTGQTMVGIQVVRMGASNRTADSDRGYNDDRVEPVVHDREYGNNSYGGGDYTIQTGAFYSRKNAEDLKKKVDYITGKSATIKREEYLYKVRISGMHSKNEVSRIRRLLDEENIPTYMVDSR